MMRIPICLSVGFHIAVFFLAIFGLPSQRHVVLVEHNVIDVEISEEPKVPEPKIVQSSMNNSKKETKLASHLPPKDLTPLERIRSQVRKAPEVSKVEEKTRESKSIALPPKPKKKPKLRQPQFAPRPKYRPKPDFASMMLKTVQKLKKIPSRPKQKPSKSKETFDHKMVELMRRKSFSRLELNHKSSLGNEMSISEIDLIRRQIERCWLVPAALGSKNVEDMIVTIRMKLNPDGTLKEARIVDRFRMEMSATYKAVGESALRAVRNPRCSKFKLPLQKFSVWKDVVLSFNPSRMVGQ